MTYEAFREQYTGLFKAMMNYAPGEVGSTVFAEKMAALADAHPGFAERVESEEGSA